MKEIVQTAMKELVAKFGKENVDGLPMGICTLILFAYISAGFYGAIQMKAEIIVPMSSGFVLLLWLIRDPYRRYIDKISD